MPNHDKLQTDTSQQIFDQKDDIIDTGDFFVNIDRLHMSFTMNDNFM